jgi:hypothetical protein
MNRFIIKYNLVFTNNSFNYQVDSRRSSLLNLYSPPGPPSLRSISTMQPRHHTTKQHKPISHDFASTSGLKQDGGAECGHDLQAVWSVEVHLYKLRSLRLASSLIRAKRRIRPQTITSMLARLAWKTRFVFSSLDFIFFLGTRFGFYY